MKPNENNDATTKTVKICCVCCRDLSLCGNFGRGGGGAKNVQDDSFKTKALIVLCLQAATCFAKEHTAPRRIQDAVFK